MRRPNNVIRDIVWETLLKNIRENAITVIHTKDLGIRKLNDGTVIDFAELFEALKQNHSIAELDLSDCKLNDEKVAGLADVLRTNNAIKTLNLSKNNLTSNGIIEICETMIINYTVNKIDLSHNPIEDVGAELLAILLQNNFGLLELILKNCGIGDHGAILLAQGLENNKSLCLLDLEGNAMTTVAHPYFETLIKQFYPLNTLLDNPSPKVLMTVKSLPIPYSSAINVHYQSTGVTNQIPIQSSYTVSQSKCFDTLGITMKFNGHSADAGLIEQIRIAAEKNYEISIKATQEGNKQMAIEFLIKSIRLRALADIFPAKMSESVSTLQSNLQAVAAVPAPVLPTASHAVATSFLSGTATRLNDPSYLRDPIVRKSIENIVNNPANKERILRASCAIQKCLNSTIDAALILQTGLIDPTGHSVANLFNMVLYKAAGAVPFGAGIIIELLGDTISYVDKKLLIVKLQRVANLLASGDPRLIAEFSQRVALNLVINDIQNILSLNFATQNHFHIPHKIKKVFKILANMPLDPYDGYAKESVKPIVKQIMDDHIPNDIAIIKNQIQLPINEQFLKTVQQSLIQIYSFGSYAPLLTQAQAQAQAQQPALSYIPTNKIH